MEQSLMDKLFFIHMSLDQPYAHMALAASKGAQIALHPGLSSFIFSQISGKVRLLSPVCRAI